MSAEDNRGGCGVQQRGGNEVRRWKVWSLFAEGLVDPAGMGAAMARML